MEAARVRLKPLMTQIALAPVLAFRHRMPSLPYALQTSRPATIQHAVDTDWMNAVLVTLNPVISQIALAPVLVFRHRMSALPSPLKSPTPAIVHPAGDIV